MIRLRAAVVSVLVASAVGVFAPPTDACCPAPPANKPVVNADQTVIVLWDKEKQTEHFIRRASFKSDADDFGFLVPTPAEPELAESGDAAFPMLADITKPEIVKQERPSQGCGCPFMVGVGGAKSGSRDAPPPQVAVLQEKTVAGFHAVVLEAKSANALVGWLNEHGYELSPAVAAWAKPYIDQGWKITALKVAKPAKDEKRIAAASLRMSFKTDRPLFPYREPDPGPAGAALAAESRMLRFFFIGDARYEGALGKGLPWNHEVMWSNRLAPEQRQKLLDLIQLPQTTGPGTFWMTELEDPWLRGAPEDLYFAPAADQSSAKRPPWIEYVSTENDKPFALACVFLPPLALRIRRRRRR